MTCEVCGCTGIHACPGHYVGKWPQAEKDKLREALQRVADREAAKKQNTEVQHERAE